MASESAQCAPEPMGSEEMLFMLHTSGSTGKPKGIVHTQAGYLLYAALTHQVCLQLTPLWNTSYFREANTGMVPSLKW